MASPFKQLHIKSAVKGSSNFDLSSHHLTTIDFGQIVPIFVQHEVMPGDHFNVKQNIFSRIAPLAVPTYGNLWIKTATFFVPYHQVAYDMESWLSGDQYINGHTTHNRNFRYSYLIGLFLNHGKEPEEMGFDVKTPVGSSWAKITSNDLVTRLPQEAEVFDFQLRSATPQTQYQVYKFKFTQLGRYYYKILRSLGYGFFEDMSLNPASSSYSEWNVSINGLPLLSFFKAYNDWMSQSAVYNRSRLSNYLQRIRYATVELNDEVWMPFLLTAFDDILLQYEANYFTTAWESPNEIISGQGYNSKSVSPDTGISSVLPQDIDLIASSTTTHNEADRVNSEISAIGLRFLNAFDKFLRRNNYSGARSVEKLLSRFGVKTEDYRNEFAILLDTSKSILQIGDVTNQTDTGDNSRPLGSYAGKGIISGDNAFSFKSSDFGTIITLCWLQPDVQYYQGIDRTIIKYAVSDFYQPEYDSLDAMPIAQCELSQNPRGDSAKGTNLPLKAFGFTERYNELRHGRSRVTGDFSLDYDMHCWHFGMEQSYLDGIEAKAQSPQIISQPQLNNQFDRIFVDETDEAEDMRDHFYMTCYFDVNARRNMMNISEVANLGDGSLNIQRNGTQLS